MASRTGITRLDFFLASFFSLAALAFLFSIFQNLQYPLMWADEAMTAVGADRVLHYGYPKVHDGKNVFYDLRHSNPSLGIDEKTDAYIGGSNWGHYYFLAPFEKLAERYANPYKKTFLLRLPFAVTGVCAIAILLFTFVNFLPTFRTRIVFSLLFVLFECASVSLVLHFREVRYYSLQLLALSAALSVFSFYNIRNVISFRTYFIILLISLLVLFFSFTPAFFILLTCTGFYLTAEFGIQVKCKSKDRSSVFLLIRKFLCNASPLIAVVIIIIPFLSFFKTFYISKELNNFYGFSARVYLENLGAIWNYFYRYDVIVFAAMVIFLRLFFAFRSNKTSPQKPLNKLSILLILFFLFYFFFICKIPNYLFTRYFIALQPFLTGIFLINSFILLDDLSRSMEKTYRGFQTLVVLILFVAGITVYFGSKNYLLGHLYELRHPYKGVLDYTIPYIQQHFSSPEKLTIATNYEEASYEYYLKCKVTVGFLKYNLHQDLSIRPDIIIFRRTWQWQNDKQLFSALLNGAIYKAVYFPVINYGVNSMPEINPEKQMLRHQFKTLYTDDHDLQAIMYIKNDLPVD